MSSTRFSTLLMTGGLMLAVQSAQAGIFDDDEARRQLIELRNKTEARFDQQAKAQLELANQLQRQADEIAKLRGQLETMAYKQETGDKRVQDLYVDLDTRLRKLESAVSSNEGATQNPAPAVDPAQENQQYESALAQFKGGKYKDAANALTAFLQAYPNSTLAPNALFWLGNAWYAQQNCYKAIDMQNQVLSRFPTSNKAPDALLAIATCQQDLGNPSGAKRSLENLLTRYPNTPAADTARDRLKKK